MRVFLLIVALAIGFFIYQREQYYHSHTYEYLQCIKAANGVDALAKADNLKPTYPAANCH